jgi:hypothetical protein
MNAGHYFFVCVPMTQGQTNSGAAAFEVPTEGRSTTAPILPLSRGEDPTEDIASVIPAEAFDWKTPEPSPRIWKSSSLDGKTPSTAQSTPAGITPGGSARNFSRHQQVGATSHTPLTPSTPSPSFVWNGNQSFVSQASFIAEQTFSSQGETGVSEMDRLSQIRSSPIRLFDGPRLTTLPVPRSPSLRPLQDTFTTLVVRNIPARYSQDMLLLEFQPDGAFDLFFLPYSFRDGRTMGYAFLNFRNHRQAITFQQRWHRQFLNDHGRTKHLDVAAATVQGLLPNLRQFNARSLLRLQRVGKLPALFDERARRLDTISELIRYGIIRAARASLSLREDEELNDS